MIPAQAEETTTPEPEVTVIVTAGGDDVSYQVPLEVTVVYDDVAYSSVYATTNSVITFGNPDGTYWTYPNTPSVSIESRDWWALPQQMPDTHFIISVSEGGFQVDGAYRPFGTYTGEVTNIVITAQITTSGEVEYTYSVQGPLYGGERTGARLTDGSVVPLEEIGITEVEQPVELAPTPVEPTPEPSPVEPTPSPTEPTTPDTTPTEPNPSPTPQPERPRPIIVVDIEVPSQPITEEPQPEQPLEAVPVVEEVPAVVEVPLEESQPQPIEEPAQENPLEEPILPPSDNQPDEPSDDSGESQTPTVEESVEALLEEANGEPVTLEAIQEAGVSFEDLPPLTPIEIREDESGNAVIITAEVAAALVLLDNPIDLLSGLFDDPAQVLLALNSIGADMSDEEREESSKTIVAAVIVGSIAVQSAAGAAVAGSISYRRRV